MGVLGSAVGQAFVVTILAFPLTYLVVRQLVQANFSNVRIAGSATCVLVALTISYVFMNHDPLDSLPPLQIVAEILWPIFVSAIAISIFVKRAAT